MDGPAILIMTVASVGLSVALTLMVVFAPLARRPRPLTAEPPLPDGWKQDEVGGFVHSSGAIVFQREDRCWVVYDGPFRAHSPVSGRNWSTRAEAIAAVDMWLWMQRRYTPPLPEGNANDD